MHKIIILFLLLSSIQSGFSQENEKFEMGVFLSPFLSNPRIDADDVNTVSNVEISSRPGFGFGFIFLFKLNKKVRIRALFENELRYNELVYRESDEQIKETIDPYLINFPIQFNYHPINPLGLNLILSYSPKLIIPNDESQVQNNLASFDSSIDFGIGYEIEFSAMKMHPEIQYSFGISNIWKSQGSDLGQAVSSLNYNTFSFILSIYSGDFKKK